jgi:hypothetical protein
MQGMRGVALTKAQSNQGNVELLRASKLSM